ncbi:hypothetical protein NDU88_007106 [Pleurodeles waltl]|uniref:Uncharacterized protein n=1 Tax=Pleurodeles waltl TaxID=8319 RepID=A0AAV7N166_PLEWA|nr:hypothetical protein NDU88_007106 [Pleurodeles waltl]
MGAPDQGSVEVVAVLTPPWGMRLDSVLPDKSVIPRLRQLLAALGLLWQPEGGPLETTANLRSYARTAQQRVGPKKTLYQAPFPESGVRTSAHHVLPPGPNEACDTRYDERFQGLSLPMPGATHSAHHLLVLSGRGGECSSQLEQGINEELCVCCFKDTGQSPGDPQSTGELQSQFRPMQAL